MKKQGNLEPLDTETVSNDSIKKNTSINGNTSIEASEHVYDIRDEIQTSGIFRYPLLDEFLGKHEKMPGILTEAEIVNGNYGESAGLKINDKWYRSSSKPIIDEAKQLLERNLFPCRVYVAKIRAKSGRTFYTLRGDENR